AARHQSVQPRAALRHELLVRRGLGPRKRRCNPASGLGDRLAGRAGAAHRMLVGAIAPEYQVSVAVDQARSHPGAVERVYLPGASAGELGALADAHDSAVGDPDRAIVDDSKRVAGARLERRDAAV